MAYAKATAFSGSGSGGGDVTGPGSSTNNGIVLWDGTAGTDIKDSAVTLAQLRRDQATGLLTGGGLTVNANPAKFDLASGTGVVVDNYTDPANPVVTQVSWNAFSAQTVTNIATQSQTVIGINSSGAIVQLTGLTLAQDTRDYILVGLLAHPNNTSISSVSNIGLNLAYANPSALVDLASAIGSVNVSGNVYSANGANLNINKSAGTAFSMGTNVKTSKKDPNTFTFASTTAGSFFYTYKNGSGGYTVSASTSSIVPGSYDDGDGTLGTVTSNRWTIQRIYLSGAGTIIHYGQATYTSKALATDGILTEAFTINPILTGALLRGFLLVRGAATALNSSGDASFIEAGKFGTTSSATSATTTLQQSYDNSTTPEIVTDSTRGALSVKRGSAADTDVVLEGQNAAGTNTFTVTGNGLVNSATLTASRALATDSSKNLVSSAVTDTELGYVSGVTSAIQTQITAKMTNPMTTGGDVIYGGASGAPTRLANGSSGQVLTSAGGTSAPTWGAGTTAATASTVAGRDANSNLSANNHINGYRTQATAASTTTLVVGDVFEQTFTGATTQNCKMPVATTLVNGQQWYIVNNSSGVVTVQSSGANTIQAMAANSSCLVTCINTAGGTGTASWNWDYKPATSGTQPLANGGTGQTTKAAAFDALSPMTTGGDVIYGGASGTGTRLANGSAGQVLTSAGGTSAHTWGSGTTAATASTVAGRDANANLSNANNITGYATTATAAGTTTLTVASVYQQYFTGSTTQTVVLPVATTLVNGQQFRIINNSSGAVTVQSSGLNTIQAMNGSTELLVTCINTAGGTGTASWSAVYRAVGTVPEALGGTGLTALGTGVATFLATPSSSNLRSAITDETGTGALVFNPMTATSDMIVGTTSGAVARIGTGLLGRFQMEYTTATATMTIATPCVVTYAGHGRVTGDRCFFTTSGALPTGLSINTTYWITKVDANTFNLSTSLSNCLAGTLIATSGTQSGTHTIYVGGMDNTTGIPGILTGTAPASGYIGEVLSASATTAWSTSLTTMTSISLTPGVWMVSAQSYFNGGAVTRQLELYVSTTTNSAGSGTISNGRQSYIACDGLSGLATIQLLPVQFLVTATQTVYAVTRASSIAGSASPEHRIQAIRVA